MSDVTPLPEDQDSVSGLDVGGQEPEDVEEGYLDEAEEAREQILERGDDEQ